MKAGRGCGGTLKSFHYQKNTTRQQMCCSFSTVALKKEKVIRLFVVTESHMKCNHTKQKQKLLIIFKQLSSIASSELMQ